MCVLVVMTPTAKLLHHRRFEILTDVIVFLAVFTHRCIGTAGDNFKGVENQVIP